MDWKPTKIEKDEVDDFASVCRAEGVDPGKFKLSAVVLYPAEGVGHVQRKVRIGWTRSDGTLDEELLAGGSGDHWLATFGHLLRTKLRDQV